MLGGGTRKAHDATRSSSNGGMVWTCQGAGQTDTVENRNKYSTLCTKNSKNNQNGSDLLKFAKSRSARLKLHHVFAIDNNNSEGGNAGVPELTVGLVPRKG